LTDQYEILHSKNRIKIRYSNLMLHNQGQQIPPDPSKKTEERKQASKERKGERHSPPHEHAHSGA
jgi:hypothetical protein